MKGEGPPRGLGEQEALREQGGARGQDNTPHALSTVLTPGGVLLVPLLPQQVHRPYRKGETTRLLSLSKTLCNPTTQRKGTSGTQPGSTQPGRSRKGKGAGGAGLLQQTPHRGPASMICDRHGHPRTPGQTATAALKRLHFLLTETRKSGD